MWQASLFNHDGNAEHQIAKILHIFIENNRVPRLIQYFKKTGLCKNDFSLARMPTNIGLTKLNSPSKLIKMYCEDLANSVVEAIQKACVFFFSKIQGQNFF